jgi:sulfide:quinone oxidoreductase
MTKTEKFQALIVGGGVAGLEGALALRELLGDRVSTTLLAPDSEFTYRPLRVREPFAYSAAPTFSLEKIAGDIGVTLVRDRFRWLEADRQVVHTEGGRQLRYDALVIALGARLYPSFRHALTVDDQRLDEQLHGLVRDVEDGYVRRLAFVVPSQMPWPLPVYELALMTATRAYDMNLQLSTTILTPEDRPLALFGDQVSDAVAGLLEQHGIGIVTSAHCSIPQPGKIVIHPGDRTLAADRIVALPELVGPDAPGVPRDSTGGFIPVDSHCKVRGLERVYAAGDATDFAIKHGGIAAQQADTAAIAIAAIAGAAVEPKPFAPVIHGVLLGGESPLYMSAHVTGGHGSTSEVSEQPDFSLLDKVDARLLSPHLHSLAASASAASAPALR